MADAIIIPDDGEGEDARGAEHVESAAANAGAAAVHEQNAAEDAESAAAAAESAQAAAALAAEGVGAAAAAADDARGAADATQAGLLAMAAALEAQTATMERLCGLLEQQQAAPEPEPVKHTPDRPPAESSSRRKAGPRWYYGGK